MLLQPADVPAHLVASPEWEPSEWVTDPADCADRLNANGPGDLRVGQAYEDPEGFVSYESMARYDEGLEEELEPFREAMTGVCAEPFQHFAEGTRIEQRFELLADPDVGEDAFAARTDLEYELQGHPVSAYAYMVYFRRGEISVQVQVLTGEMPTIGITGPEIGLDQVEQLARAIDERLAALQAGRGAA